MSEIDTIKGFHAVEEARRWKLEVWNEIKDMNRQEMIKYFNRSKDTLLKSKKSDKDKSKLTANKV